MKPRPIIITQKCSTASCRNTRRRVTVLTSDNASVERRQNCVQRALRSTESELIWVWLTLWDIAQLKPGTHSQLFGANNWRQLPVQYFIELRHRYVPYFWFSGPAQRCSLWHVLFSTNTPTTEVAWLHFYRRSAQLKCKRLYSLYAKWPQHEFVSPAAKWRLYAMVMSFCLFVRLSPVRTSRSMADWSSQVAGVLLGSARHTDGGGDFTDLFQRISL